MFEKSWILSSSWDWGGGFVVVFVSDGINGLWAGFKVLSSL